MLASRGWPAVIVAVDELVRHASRMILGDFQVSVLRTSVLLVQIAKDDGMW